MKIRILGPFHIPLYAFHDRRQKFYNVFPSHVAKINNKDFENKRPTGLNSHPSIRDFTLTSYQRGSYLYINSPIIE